MEVKIWVSKLIGLTMERVGLEAAQRLGALFALPENLSLISSTHIRQLMNLLDIKKYQAYVGEHSST